MTGNWLVASALAEGLSRSLPLEGLAQLVARDITVTLRNTNADSASVPVTVAVG